MTPTTSITNGTATEEALRAEIARLRAALEPFANFFEGNLENVGGGTLVSPSFTVGVFKDAKAALAPSLAQEMTTNAPGTATQRTNPTVRLFDYRGTMADVVVRLELDENLRPALMLREDQFGGLFGRLDDGTGSPLGKSDFVIFDPTLSVVTIADFQRAGVIGKVENMVVYDPPHFPRRTVPRRIGELVDPDLRQSWENARAARPEFAGFYAGRPDSEDYELVAVIPLGDMAGDADGTLKPLREQHRDFAILPGDELGGFPEVYAPTLTPGSATRSAVHAAASEPAAEEEDAPSMGM